MEKSYYYYVGEIFCEWEESDSKFSDRLVPKRHSEEVSGMVEYLEMKTPVEAYNGIVELNKIAFIEKLKLTEKENAEFKMLITKLQKF